jgi:ADP-heptose:LPS heptosyltransferase
MTRILVVRLDSMGDVLLAGPAVAALSEIAHVDLLCSSIGHPAAELLPGVDRTLVFDAPWILSPAPPVDPPALGRIVSAIESQRYDAAAVLTSSHQSPLPTALLLRIAGIGRIAAVSHDYPGSLLDHRFRGDPDVHEVRRALMIAGALGASPCDRPLSVEGMDTPVQRGRVAVHPGASASARTLDPDAWAGIVAELARAGAEVVVTGGPGETDLCRQVAGATGAAIRIHSRGELRRFAGLLASAEVVVSGNTGPMHLAAAVGRPAVAIFPPTVPVARWAPWMVPHVVLGDHDVPCAGCRAQVCPLETQRCTADVRPDAVIDAIEFLSDSTLGRKELRA